MKNGTSWAKEKNSKSSKIIILEPWAEIIDFLVSYEFKNLNEISIELSENKIILIPFSQRVLDVLSTLIGKKVAILRTDLKEKPYIIKAVD